MNGQQSLDAQLAAFSAQLEAALVKWLQEGDPCERWYAVYKPQQLQCKLVKGRIPKGWALLDQERVSPAIPRLQLKANLMKKARVLPILRVEG